MRSNVVKSKRKRILIVLATLNPSLQRGIVNYAREQNWALDFTYQNELNNFPTGNIDGTMVLSGYYRNKEAVKSFIAQLTVPVVSVMGVQWFGKGIPQVWSDEKACARKAIDYFIRTGYKHIAYINSKKNVNLITQKYYNSGVKFHNIKLNNIIEQLAGIPTPFAFIAPDDLWAVSIYKKLEALGLDIPGEVAIMGQGDLKDICELNYVPLSSVNSRREECGYKAAEVLNLMMRGEKLKESVILIPPGDLVIRESTALQPISDKRVAKGMSLILFHFHNALLDLNYIAEEVGLCRWSMDMAFRQHLNMTMNQYLAKCRLDHAKELLINSDKKIRQIVDECGFCDRTTMLRLFASKEKCSPSQFRKANQTVSPVFS